MDIRCTWRVSVTTQYNGNDDFSGPFFFRRDARSLTTTIAVGFIMAWLWRSGSTTMNYSDELVNHQQKGKEGRDGWMDGWRGMDYYRQHRTLGWAITWSIKP